MTLTLELTSQQEYCLKSLAESQQVAIESIVDRFLTSLSEGFGEDDEDEDIDDITLMCAEFSVMMPTDVPPLPADFSRADIYMDHD